MSSSCFPVSTTSPFSTTAIMSALRIVERRCAITIVVRPPFSSSSSSASCTICSDSLSRADVASSRSKIFGFLTNTLAMAILCFCPPDNWAPLSPTFVSYPSGNALMKSWQLAMRAASSICSCVAPGDP
mmetsp:Transcript_16711/g.38415  ORF Transcript_16711/g.38415 Transcript_16711/m.38415 type:complete len:129 (-) Transcript_16711:57-443(-)